MAGEQFSLAVGFVSNRKDGYPYRLEFTLESLLDLEYPGAYVLMVSACFCVHISVQ